MYCDVTRRLELLRPVRLDVFNKKGNHHKQLRRHLNQLKRQLIDIDIKEVGCQKSPRAD